ncbi:hypothetical protein AVEN_95338-1 [Araneus ventricosus]|uniref:Uncharacterized protein n=1 Tax=Araneus ventricosus TaxID=182803 RepID=A0A4Y2EIJ8_ARAVE|nr:hypothetical protein AVEN_95338-1 [Araneus ventricosus]
MEATHCYSPGTIQTDLHLCDRWRMIQRMIQHFGIVGQMNVDKVTIPPGTQPDIKVGGGSNKTTRTWLHFQWRLEPDYERSQEVTIGCVLT